MNLYFEIREKIRFNPGVNRALYTLQNLYCSFAGRLVGDVRRAKKSPSNAKGVALCLRFREEARYLAEWLEYYQAAGVEHFFLYNNFSSDDFLSAIQPWLVAGAITLVDWPRIPASPAAEEDCIRRALGRFAWVGFLDADEFVVIRGGRSIPEFLATFERAPGVGLHWRFYGSSGHIARPALPVIAAYQHRAKDVNRHIKTFVRPDRVAQCRNSHAWFYSPIATAVGEHGNSIYGSFASRPSADLAWINHYYCKSEQDYREKMIRVSTQDKVGIRFPSRRPEKLANDMGKNNEELDTSATEYYRARCAILNCLPGLLESGGAPESSILLARL